ncbi:hypothetical protein [Streptomyces sp. NBC_00306]|uniref:hypothetical protein n=1 Tax=Streptomyces sp. NBC_00306 TaxID=2975708 RepID=UPI002E28F038|nr:hypothetical protein [Streptomyces sp. NBC_00306]
MRTRTAAAIAATLLLALTACSGEDEPDKPAVTVTATKSPALSKAEIAKQCTDAVALLEPNDKGEIPSEPVPAQCKGLGTDEYLDAYYDGIQQANKLARQDLQRQIEEAEQQDQ